MNANGAKQKTAFHWFILVGIVFFQVLAHTMIRTESTQTILRISKSQETLGKINSYTKELVLEREQLMSDSRITRIGRQQLGLKKTQLNQTIYLEKGEANDT